MNDWIKYEGEYEKEFYDIKLHSGEIIPNCWPNAGTFHTGLDRIVDGGEVSHFRLAVYENPPNE